MPLDNSDLMDKYIYFESVGIKNAIKQILRIYPEFEEVVAEKITEKTISNKIK